MASITVPIQGDNIRHESNNLGRPIDTPSPPAPEVPQVASPTQPNSDTPVQGTSGATKSDPFVGMEIVFDKNNRARWVNHEKAALIRAENGQPETEEAPADAPTEELPELPQEETPANPPTPPPSQQPIDLNQRIAQLENALITFMTGQQPQAQKEAEPNYEEIDLYDPRQLSSFIRNEMQTAMKGIIDPHLPTIKGARVNQELRNVEAKYSADKNYSNRILLAQQLVEANPEMTMENAYKIATHSETVLNAGKESPQPTQNNAVPPSGISQPTTRTLTAEQAQKKAEQAKRLPKPNSGASGVSSRVNPPTGMKGLGDMMAHNYRYNRSQ